MIDCYDSCASMGIWLDVHELVYLAAFWYSCKSAVITDRSKSIHWILVGGRVGALPQSNEAADVELEEASVTVYGVVLKNMDESLQ